MVKGTSRQVIVVHAPEEKLFDQAIFILRDGAPGEGVSDEALLREARQCLDHPRQQSWLHNGPLWGTMGAALTGLVWLLSLAL